MTVIAFQSLDGGIFEVLKKEETAVFDVIPAQAREALNGSRFKYSAVECVLICQTRGMPYSAIVALVAEADQRLGEVERQFNVRKCHGTGCGD